MLHSLSDGWVYPPSFMWLKLIEFYCEQGALSSHQLLVFEILRYEGILLAGAFSSYRLGDAPRLTMRRRQSWSHHGTEGPTIWWGWRRVRQAANSHVGFFCRVYISQWKHGIGYWSVIHYAQWRIQTPWRELVSQIRKPLCSVHHMRDGELSYASVFKQFWWLAILFLEKVQVY